MYNEKHNKFTTVYNKLCNKSKAYNKLTTCWKYCGFVATNWQQLVHNQSTAFRQIHSKLYNKSTANQSNGIWANVAETTQIKQLQLEITVWWLVRCRDRSSARWIHLSDWERRNRRHAASSIHCKAADLRQRSPGTLLQCYRTLSLSHADRVIAGTSCRWTVVRLRQPLRHSQRYFTLLRVLWTDTNNQPQWTAVGRCQIKHTVS